ncbi:dTDP-4-dehydrorhamnose 3,5-epimerase [Candidatus Peregrinibacteria bacterium]|jgi:dTDP-4-dehydrorhamnose 3,5-epimerase|nr:dTDP-4-dehydrorhamnose 3,5-epimerase [Candidatus Peregrinibacteria bacterium]MBT4056166.1 dTDP-4-dehydrorhamnose 3,5-epimerase [Candidatus Peregrinibacteria bacterium]
MKFVGTKSLSIPDIKVITFGRFPDHRGYFTETFRKSDFQNEIPEIAEFMKDIEFTQANESFSKAGTFRGLHFQWNPYMGKLVRPITGHLIDFALDIRKNSPTFGKIIAYDMPANLDNTEAEWIWLPPGFAHGVFLPEDSLIEYMCSGEYSQGCEAGISPLAEDIDWSLCDPELKKIFDENVPTTELITDKDKDGMTLAQWGESENSDQFIYQQTT